MDDDDRHILLSWHAGLAYGELLLSSQMFSNLLCLYGSCLHSPSVLFFF